MFRNRLCIDGGLTLFMPPTSAAQTVFSIFIETVTNVSYSFFSDYKKLNVWSPVVLEILSFIFKFGCDSVIILVGFIC